VKLYRFDYSCYARKVQMVLDLLHLPYECVDVPYGDRTELATVTGGYIQVPVLVDDRGRVLIESRRICEVLLEEAGGSSLVPAPWEGPIWAYADWCDGPLEDVCFRLATPGLCRRFERAADRALFTFIKERKFGRGCVDQWERAQDELLSRSRAMLAPTVSTLKQQSFVFGAHPTLADAALYGQLIMIKAAGPDLLRAIDSSFPRYMERLEATAHGV